MEADRSCIGGMLLFIYFYASPRHQQPITVSVAFPLANWRALEKKTRSHHWANTVATRYPSYRAIGSKGPVTVVGLVGLKQI